MLLFGHPGLTLGVVLSLDALIVQGRHLFQRNEQTERQTMRSDETAPDTNSSPDIKMNCLSGIWNHVDVRILLVGSLLSDIIDKPLGIYALKGIVDNGRMFSHTLLFLVAISVAGWWVYWKYCKAWLAVLAFGILTHLVFDSMWNTPKTLFWPWFGFAFEKEDTSSWIQYNLHSLFTKPSYYLPEILGIVVLILFLWFLAKSRKIGSFIRDGKIV